jgi:hypothetical protein
MAQENSAVHEFQRNSNQLNHMPSKSNNLISVRLYHIEDLALSKSSLGGGSEFQLFVKNHGIQHVAYS